MMIQTFLCKQVGEEILEPLTKPTAKERSVAEKFKSHGGAQVVEFCPHGTKLECLKAQQATAEMEAKKKKDQQQQTKKAKKLNNIKLLKRPTVLDEDTVDNKTDSEEPSTKRLKSNGRTWKRLMKRIQEPPTPALRTGKLWLTPTKKMKTKLNNLQKTRTVKLISVQN
uniref:Uncharacterized protein n=1 Tax=Glossina brevipalpis TaxID=37001 RepID=A0A1A9WSD1_9MUSC